MNGRAWTGLVFAAALVAAAVTLGGQSSSEAAWSGRMRSASGSRPARYLIPAIQNLRSFQILLGGSTSDDRPVSATDLRFEGISLRFRAGFANGADCRVDAVPARGYRGGCAMVTGDTLELEIVPPVPGMLLVDHEIMIAREAGAGYIARDASVFVLGAAGYTEAVRGTNGFTCFVERPTPADLWPICHNRPASDRLLPVEQFRARLRVAGLREQSITDSVLLAYRSGRFLPPPSGAIGYMLSMHAWTASPTTGAPSFIAPHLHFYAPGATNASIGVEPTQRAVVPMRVEREGRPDASIIVGVKVLSPPAGN